MQKWEHRIEKTQSEAVFPDLLVSLGNLGWELVAVDHQQQLLERLSGEQAGQRHVVHHWMLFFKRPLDEDAAKSPQNTELDEGALARLKKLAVTDVFEKKTGSEENQS